MLTTALAREVHVLAMEETEARGLGTARLTAHLGVASEISAGEKLMKNVDVAILDALPKCTGGAGALGYTFFRDSFVAIEYSDSELVFYDSSGGVPREFLGAAHVPLRLASPERPVLLVALRMQDGSDSTLLLDTGVSGTFLSPRLAARLGLEGHANEEVVGAAEGQSAYAAELPRLSLGDGRIEGLEVQIVDAFESLGQALGTTVDGNLGYDALARFLVGLDYPNERLYLVD
jgi:hypothetical protein